MSKSFFIIGANGQLGTALRKQYPEARFADSDELDITDKTSVDAFDWEGIDVILNAAAYTNVDGAEAPEGKLAAWKVNDEAVGYLAETAKNHDMTVVHVSTAYVFDGTKPIYTESDAVSPLGEYAKSKAAGEARLASCEKSYVIRTDSVIGEGKNFVRTMLGLASKGIDPTVVADQMIRPTFTGELVRAIDHLLKTKAPYGIYNVTNEGAVVSWADFTRAIFREAEVANVVHDTTLVEYSSSKEGIAPRPLNSVLDLSKIESTGFSPADWKDSLSEYVKKELR
jgi:dTDP-4-dehydrorhamnose 3,5-epimerase